MIEGILIGAGVFAWGFITGRFWPARRKGPQPVRPICGCDHHHSFHAPKTGQCHGKVYEGMGVYVSCTCRQYTGPLPLPEVYAQEIAS